MSNSSDTGSFKLNIGTSSILLIFVTLCLVAFATLTLVSANADNKLSAKVAERSQAYYSAQNDIAQKLAELDSTLISAYDQASDQDEYFASVGYEKSYQVPISDMQALTVTVAIQYPTNPDDTYYRISSWKVITTTEVEYENNMIVITD